jgi:hypothetical protein
MKFLRKAEYLRYLTLLEVVSKLAETPATLHYVTNQKNEELHF